MIESIQRRNEQLRQTHIRLPGSRPYDNIRPINVPARFEGHTLFDCLAGMHPHISHQQWQDWFEQGHILKDDRPLPMNHPVRGGQQYSHLFPDTVEPDVDAGIEILWEDDVLIAVYKPAPLPVHPCGRFNLNSMTSLLSSVYQPSDLRLVHRLDANTTGVMLLARTGEAATNLRLQFESNLVEKTYLTQCLGVPEQTDFECHAPISRERGAAGLRAIDPDGLPARTVFRRLLASQDTALLQARPITGRTNQIRIHLWSLGIPVVGDPAYLPNHDQAELQTLTLQQPPMCLHAASIRFQHPRTQEFIELQSPKPSWLAELSQQEN